jgi:uncharacterized protein (TIGR03067 family)
MKRHVLMLLAVGFLTAADEPKEDAKKELEKFKGTWQITSTEREGQKTDDLNKSKLIVTGDTFAVHENGLDLFKGTVKLDLSKRPKTIDWMIASGDGKGQTALGIYTLDGDDLKFCWGQPGKERPAGFTTKAGSRDMVVVLKRENK